MHPHPIAPADVLVLCAHPHLEQSRVHRRAAKAARKAGARPGASILVRDLYALYPDYEIDVETEQALLAAARLVVWQHPIQWYSMPPLMKLWIDEVLTFGWAYGPGGTQLRGKDLWLVTSTGGAAESYQPERHHGHRFEDFLPPYEQTANLCGLRFLPPRILHGAHRASQQTIDGFVGDYVERLVGWPRWPELDGLLYGLPVPVQEDERPDDAEDDAGPPDPETVAADLDA